MGYGIHAVKLFSVIFFLVRPLCLKLFADRKYHIEHNVFLTVEPIKQKWNGLAQHIAFFVNNNTDIVVLTIFSNMSNVSIYSVYHLVLNGVSSVLISMTIAMTSYFGNILAKNEREKLINIFDFVEWLLHNIITFFFTATAILIIPFVKIYTTGIEDANYIVPTFSAVLTLAYALRELRTPYTSIIFAAGHFKQTQWSSILEALINIFISIVAVAKYGLIGVATGTAFAMFYRMVYLATYLSKNIMNRELKHFIKHILVDCIITIVSIFLCFQFQFIHICGGYQEWFLMSMEVSALILGIAFIVNTVFYKKQLSILYGHLQSHQKINARRISNKKITPG